MRFSVQQVTKSGRTGYLYDMERLPEVKLETPLLLMHTRGGHIPHLTYDVFQFVTKDRLPLQVPLSTTITSIDSIAEHGGSVADFAGLTEYPTYVTPHDPTVLLPSGYNIKDSIVVWSRNGKTEVDPQSYMDMMEKMKPEMYLGLYDGDTDATSSGKRIAKSLGRTSRMVRDCLQRHRNSKVLQNKGFLAAVVGGYDIRSRRKAALEMAEQPVIGYVIDGLHNNGGEVENLSYTSVAPVISECLNILPEDRIRVIHGAWNPSAILHLVAAGFDVFDASLTYLATERGAALTFPFNKALLESSNGEIKTKNGKNHSYEINLEEDEFAEDFSPLLESCTCLACRQHTRAYIHHLLKTRELLAKVLLMIHNTHHYVEFFKAIRDSIQINRLEELQKIVAGQ